MRRLAILLCLAGLLAGCGSHTSSAPVSLPPVTASLAPTSAAPSASAVPKPADADAFTSEGAASFVRYYIDVINAAIHANDSTLLSKLSAPECEGCQRYLQSIAETKSENAHVHDGGITVNDAVAPPLEDGETTVLLDFEGSEYVSRDTDGREVHRVPATGPLTAELRCVRRDGAWIVMGFRLAPPRSAP